MERIKILIFHPTIAPYRIDLFNSIASAFETQICLSYRNLRSQKFDYSTIESQFCFKPIYLTKRLELSNRVICKGYWDIIRKFNPNIIICSEFGYDILACLTYKIIFHKKYKIVSMCDDSYDMVNNNNDFSFIHRYLRKRITPNLNGLILVEPDTKMWFHQNFGKGFYFPIVAKDERIRQQYRESISISNKYISQYKLNNKKVYLFVGRLVSIKNVHSLISAFDKARLSDSILVIVGDGPENENLKRLASHNANIILTGRLEGNHLYAWYNIAGCFVLPSIKEPFGAVTNEALLAGCKAIVSNKAGSKCLINEGINGYTFNPTCTEEFSSLLIQINNEISPINKMNDIKPSMMGKTYNEYLAELKDYLIHLCK